jgi:hypothetical protein
MMRVFIAILFSTTILFGLTNMEVAKKSDEATDGFISQTSKMKMTLINARGQKSIREIDAKTLEGVDGDKSLMVFLTPADVKGTKMLTHEKLNRDDDQWLYLPALKRVKRIASKNKSGSFMGSEFSYEDIANSNYKEYRYNDDLITTTYSGKACYKGSRVPKDKNSGYTKQVTWVDKKNFLVQKVEYYDRKSELLKSAIFTDYTNHNGVWVMGKIHMKNHQNSKETILEWSDIKIKAGLTKGDFSKRKLK